MEEWRVIPEFLNYEVSDQGMVRGKHGIKKHWIDCKGYYHVSLWDKGKGYNRYVHTLVVETFMSQQPFGYHVHHKDKNKENNNKENLCYMVSCEHQRGENHPAAKLTKTDVIDIRIAVKNGTSKKDLCIKYNVSICHIRNIISYRKWKWLL